MVKEKEIKDTPPPTVEELQEQIADARARNEALEQQNAALKAKHQPYVAAPDRKPPCKLQGILVKVRKGHTVLLGNGPMDTKIRYGAGISGVKEDDPIELPLFRIYKKEPNPKTGLCLAGRNLVNADGSEIAPISAEECAALHAEWDALVAQREAPTSVTEQGKIFSGPKPERMVAS